MFLQVSKETEITGTHTANWICDWLRHYGWEVTDHPPYSPSVMPRDFNLFELLKKHLVGNIYIRQGVIS
jgi:hypothetical protein